MTVSEIVDGVIASASKPLPVGKDEGSFQQLKGPATHVVLTGGEPMLAKDVELLCAQLKNNGFHITIESAGTIDRDLVCDLMSISPKLSNSTPSESRAGRWADKHESTRHQPSIVAGLISRHDWQLKFVVAKESDLAEIKAYLAEVEALMTVELNRENVLLMPEGIDNATLTERASWLEPQCAESGFTFCQRKHIFWYGNKRAT